MIDIPPLAGLAIGVAKELERLARELRECARDLGYTE